MSLRVGTTLVNQLKLALIFLILFAYPRLLFDYPQDNHVSTRFNSKLPARPEFVAAVMKVLSQKDELMIKDIARLGGLTHYCMGNREKN
jgi:hypothetical protein